eukprot:gene19018-20930_t
MTGNNMSRLVRIDKLRHEVELLDRIPVNMNYWMLIILLSFQLISSPGVSTLRNSNFCVQTKHGLRRCDVYTHSHCKHVFEFYNTTRVSLNCTEKQGKIEVNLQSISTTLVTYYGAADECLKGSQWSLCLMSMPPGCNQSLEILCKEACLLVKNELCFEEWRKIETLTQNGILPSDVVIPNCDGLPSLKGRNSTCLYPKLFSDLEKIHKSKGKKPTKSNKNIIIAAAAGGGGAGLLLLIIVTAILIRRKANQTVRQGKQVNLHSLPNSDFYDGLTTVAAGNNMSNLAYTGDTGSPLVYSKQINLDDIDAEVVPRESLKFIEPLAEGAFGKVVKCEVFLPNSKSGPLLAAVKYLKDDASDKVKTSFQTEAQTMGSFDHVNIVKLLGVCIDNKGPLCMILEYMELGDLTKYIRERAGSYHASFGRKSMLPDEIEFKPPELNFTRLIRMARQIADGMAYLAERGFVHRDLATRNCLLGEQEAVKIADFGLAHDISSSESDYYRIDGQRLLPIRWLPPEALTLGKFTVHSDIWAFGVVVWELFTYGMQPYYGLANDAVCDRIRCLKLLNRPDGCPQRVYQLMKGCWKYDATKRTSFSKLNEILTSWSHTTRGLFLDDAWKLMLKPATAGLANAPTLPSKKRIQK